MRYVPSPIPIKYDYMYCAMSNKSGRMQYYKVRPGLSKIRVTRSEFIKAYNDSTILAMKPSQVKGQEMIFQMEFYI